MNTFFKANLVVLYALAVASLVLELPWGVGPYLRNISLILLAIHGVETVVMFRHVKSYQGPLGKSIALSLLFGLLHWLPLKQSGKNQTPS